MHRVCCCIRCNDNNHSAHNTQIGRVLLTQALHASGAAEGAASVVRAGGGLLAGVVRRRISLRSRPHQRRLLVLVHAEQAGVDRRARSDARDHHDQTRPGRDEHIYARGVHLGRGRH